MKVILWLSDCKPENKILFAIIIVVFFVIFNPSASNAILDIIKSILGWLDNYFTQLLTIVYSAAVLIVVYGFFVHKQFSTLLNKLIDIGLLNKRVSLIVIIGIVELVIIVMYWHGIVGYFSGGGKESDCANILNSDDEETDNANISRDGDSETSVHKIPIWVGSFITLLTAAPIAFFIWTFRNEDKRKDLQQTQENLKQSEESLRQLDFHEIQEWATSSTKPATPIDTDQRRTDILQTAAIYQLVPYLKGEHGERFIRPTIEIYHRLLSSWETEKITESEKPDYIVALHVIFEEQIEWLCVRQQKPVCEEQPNPLYKREYEKLFVNIDLKGMDLSGKELNGINLNGANLECATLTRALFKNANFERANLKKASCEETSFEDAVISASDLTEITIDSKTNFNSIKADRVTCDEETRKLVFEMTGFFLPDDYTVLPEEESKIDEDIAGLKRGA